MLNRIFVVDSVTLTSTGTAVSSYTPWDQTTRKLPTQVVVKATSQGAYVRLSNDNSAATNADVLVQAGDHVVLSVQGRRWVSVLSDGASSTVNVGALSTGVSGAAASLDLPFTGVSTLDSSVTFTRASTATFTGSNGLIQSATTNTPRFDYDPVTLAAKGLLIEEQRTNLLTYSEDLTNAAWSTTGGAATVSGNVAVAPDGATTADKIVSTVATSYGVRTPIFTSTAAEYTQSAFCKADGFNYVKFVWSSTQNATNYAVFNLTNGTITGGVYTSASITPFGNGWYRCSITSTLAAVSTYSNIWMSDGTLIRSSGVAGDGTSGILVWGAQVELGAFATSYIPTVASQVTRAVDFPAINTLSPWFNASSGSFYAEADITGTPASSRMLEVHDGTDNNRLIFYAVNSASSIRFTGIAAGVTTEAVAASSLPTSGVPFKAASAFTAGEYVVCYNGGTVGTAAPAALPTGLSAMVLGARRTGAQALNGHLRRVTFYPRRLSDAELQAITA